MNNRSRILLWACVCAAVAVPSLALPRPDAKPQRTITLSTPSGAKHEVRVAAGSRTPACTQLQSCWEDASDCLDENPRIFNQTVLYKVACGDSTHLPPHVWHVKVDRYKCTEMPAHNFHVGGYDAVYVEDATPGFECGVVGVVEKGK